MDLKRTRRRTGKVTLRDVADYAGVAMMTASRALNTPEVVSRKLRDKISEAIAATGYVQNRFAGGLASARSRLITVIVPALSSRVFSEIVQAASDVLSPRGYQILVSGTSYSLEDEEEACRRVLSWRPDGIIVSGVDHTPATREMLRAAAVPVVEAFEIGKDPIDINIGISHEQAGRVIAKHLVERGYRRPGFIGAQLDVDFRARRRLSGFKKALKARHLDLVAESRLDQPSSFRTGALGLAELLDAGHDLDAIFAANDELAIGAILEAGRRGVAVPGQLAIAGFNDLDIGAEIIPTLTTVRSPRRQMGIAAAEAILARLEGRPVGKQPNNLGVQLVVREST